MDTEDAADMKSSQLSEDVHSQSWPLPMTLKTSFRSAKEVIHSQGETLYLYLHPNKTKTTDQNTQEVVYNGLRNQGATCYLNSALQVLFMTKEFREAVESSQITPNDKLGLLYQLQRLFKDLQRDCKCVSTVSITQSLSIENVFEQQDAVEWFEKILSGVSQDASQVFEGRWQKTLRCLKKDHEGSHEENSFFSLPLAIDVRHDEVFNVVNGLEAFFKTTKFDEDDWLYCDDCDEKTDMEISFNLQKYPTILTLQLKRFYFDYMKMGYQKNCCPIDVPLTIDYFEGCTYDLYGVISHSGVYGGGHYCAYIQSPDYQDWYCFDDSHVLKMTDKDFLNRSRTAYMILYRKRESSPSSPQPEENNMESSTCEVSRTEPADELRLRMPEEIKIPCQPPSQTKTRAPEAKKRKKNRKEERSSKVTKRVCNKSSHFCAARLSKKVPHKHKIKPNSRKVPYITSGTVLVLRTGRHQGKRVVFLKHLPGGSLPLSRVSPNSATATAAAMVDISGLSIPDTMIDSSLRRRRRRRTESDGTEEHHLEREREMERPQRDERVVDPQVLTRVRKAPRVRRSLSSGLNQHDLLKSWIGWVISLVVLLMLHLHAVNIDFLNFPFL